MENWLSFFYATKTFFVVLWLPGMLHRWSRKGLRGDAIWQFFVESFFAGLVASGSMLAAFFLCSRNYATPELVKGLYALGTGGFGKVFPTESGFLTLLFVALTCLLGWVTGLTIRKLESRMTPKRFSLSPTSSLDVELFRLRSLGWKPRLTVRFRNGTELRGICRVYTFTEPRELTLEISNDESNQEKRLVWLRLDEEVERVEIEAGDIPRPKCVSLRDKLRQKENME